MKNHLIFSLFIVSILTLCGCTVDSAGGQPSADAQTPKSLALGNLGHGSAADMVYVEGGTFRMGSTKNKYKKSVCTVTVSSFYMGKYEVTQAEYQKIMGTNPSYFKGGQRPVECVSWYDAVNYCNERSVAEGLTACYTIDETNVTCNWSANGYRLPTEAEWEYAARGGKYNSPYTYSGSDNIDEVAWYYDNSYAVGSSHPNYGTYKVGRKKANALGIHDMSGNVWEWCWDWYGSDYYSNSPANNPLGPASGSYRVLRGGGWSNNASDCRCARRYGSGPDYGDYDLGFRVVRSIVDIIYVEGGTFQMGGTKYDNEKPVHTVTVSSFYMSKYEVTQAEYEAIVGSNPSCFKGGRRPVEMVSWYDAVNYCNERSKAEKLTPCYTIDSTNVTCDWNANGYRLPTEAEWEYAARGGKNNSPYTYSGSDNIDEVAWYGEAWNGSNTHEVGMKKANALGIHDMSGNVWEWCWDWYGRYYYRNSPETNPLGPASGSYRVLRGGSWGGDASNCRCAIRSYCYPDLRYYFWGFRVVRSAGQ